MGGHPSGDQCWKKASSQEGATLDSGHISFFGFRDGSDKTVTFFSQMNQQKLMVNVSTGV